jgi:hypothetical protein
MALRALITLDKHASINTKRVATRLYIYCSVHSRGCKLLPIELIIFNCWLTTLYYKATRTAWAMGSKVRQLLNFE